jgi:hypothetical protein
MNERYSISSKLKYITIIFIFIGILTVIFGFYFKSEKTWANVLLNNYYFVSIVIGATFFYAIQYITQSGWSAQFQRIPLAIGSYLPVSGILILFMIFGMHHIYNWSIPQVASADAIIAHKTPYLNIPFFFIRVFIFFSLWILMTRLLLRTSSKEDQMGGLKYFNKSELYSKIYIFILAITFSLFTFDLIMSIDVHWFSTIFAVKNFISAFYHGVAIITLIVILLNRKGYFKDLKKSHLHSFSKYIFILGLIWVYLWFMEYLLVWFGNIQEETIYFITRLNGKWKIFFFLNIILNWAIPFLVLMSGKTKQRKSIIMFVCIILIIGQWVDLFLQIMPGMIGEFKLGLIEIGTFIGYLGLFTLFITRALSKLPLIPKNHPYLNESIQIEE